MSKGRTGKEGLRLNENSYVLEVFLGEYIIIFYEEGQSQRGTCLSPYLVIVHFYDVLDKEFGDMKNGLSLSVCFTGFTCKYTKYGVFFQFMLKSLGWETFGMDVYSFPVAR